MGLMQQAIKTYDSMEKMGLVGKYESGKDPLAPIGHIIANAQIIITIDIDGNYITAEKADFKIIIPVTEESSNRTSAPAPHPLSDYIEYISNIDENKYKLYIEQLEKWVNSEYGDESLDAVLFYLRKKTVITDLKKAGLIKTDANNKVTNEKDMVSWRVIGIKNINNNENLYENLDLMKKYTSYYISSMSKNKKSVCYVTGDMGYTSSKHLQGIVSFNGRAKIISSNDKENFTYRGRFVDPEEALTVGYIASQKSHNALKWLVSNQKVLMGDRVLICWNPSGKKLPQVDSPIFKINDEKIISPSDFRSELKKVILGYKKDIGDNEDAIITSFASATTGRLSISYYNELKSSDFLERLGYWDETCCWCDSRYGTYSPTLKDIINAAYGYQRGSDEKAKIETDLKLVSQHLQRLIKCRVDMESIPRDILNAVISKTSNLQIYNRHNRRKMLFTACAVVRKYYIDNRKELCEMALDINKTDRSYQYGRLLAVLEKVEKDTYAIDEKRETNAIRMQSIYIKRPAYVTKILIEQIKNSYYPKIDVGHRTYYEKIIGQIMQIISNFDDKDFNMPLCETYLLGYYLQKNELYSKKEKQEECKDE